MEVESDGTLTAISIKDSAKDGGKAESEAVSAEDKCVSEGK